MKILDIEELAGGTVALSLDLTEQEIGLFVSKGVNAILTEYLEDELKRLEPVEDLEEKA